MINVTKTYGSIRLLHGVNLELAPDEVLGLVGDNDAGKPILTKVFSGAVTPSSGAIRIDGEQQQFTDPADSRCCHTEMIYQDLSLCDTVDVTDNLFMGREPMKSVLGTPFLDEAKMHADAGKMLEGLGVSIPGTRLLVRNLSNGQHQAVAIVRAAVLDPKVLTMDEPAIALTIAEVEAVLEFVRYVSACGVSVILVAHRLQDPFLVCDRIMVMHKGTNVAGRWVSNTGPNDIVNLIVGERFTTRPTATH